MTSPALAVLGLALVCSIFGTASEQTADLASEHATRARRDPRDVSDMTTTTNSYNPHTQHTHYDHKEFNNNYNFDDIYTDENYKEISNKLFPYSNNKRNTNYDKSNKFARKMVDRFDNVNTEDSYETKSRENSRYNKVDYKVTKEFDPDRHVSFHIDDTESTIVANKYLNFGQERTRQFEDSVIKLKSNSKSHYMPPQNKYGQRVKREAPLGKCEEFRYNKNLKKIQHPHNATSMEKVKNYYSHANCITLLEAKEGEVIQLTFVDVFHIEAHPKCQYDFLEIRDGNAGYAELLGRFCGETFPPQVTSTGRFMWLKFHSDETIEYAGFTIEVQMYPLATSYTIPISCYQNLTSDSDEVSSDRIDKTCKTATGTHALDFLWTITTAKNTNIYLNFTLYNLFKPNECEQNVIEVYGYTLEEHARLAQYCGSVATPVTTRGADDKADNEHGNVMYVHMRVSQTAVSQTHFAATYTAYRTLDPSLDETCNDDEFNCEDNTCIIKENHICDGYGHCRLKADEDGERCKGPTESMIGQTHILVILVIFSLMLASMSFVFLFKCIRKLYQESKIIKEHIQASCEDRLDALVDSRFTLDAARLQRRSSSQPRASLERDNHANELFKQQRSISQHKQTSIEADFQETRLDLEEEPWQRQVDTIPETQDVKVERNGRMRRSDTSRKEASLKIRKDSVEEREREREREQEREREREKEREKKEIRDVAVGAPDTKESGCQTRESLFQTDPAPSSDGSNSNSRGFSTFGYSGATLARPASPAPPAISTAHIELLRQLPPDTKTQKKMSDRRPMSTETTRSAPDVIIVSKPIR